MTTGHEMKSDKTTALLSDAFNTFRAASTKLEEQYAMLERRIEALNAEIAEKNRAMERNRRLAAMGEMAARIAHEIRNPLGSISILANLLERDLGPEPERRRLAEQITKGVKDLDNIVSNMLLFTSSPEANLKPVDISEAIEDSVLLTRGREGRGVSIETGYDGSTLVLGDPVQLRQLFTNLILNALDSLGESGTLFIGTRSTLSGTVEVEVRDTGEGIPESRVEKIFDPFFTTRERGTGLGLAIVASVVNAHNGTIDVSSIEGAGTTFLITLRSADRALEELDAANC